MGCLGYQKIVVFTLPETNSQFAPETLGLVQMSFLLQKPPVGCKLLVLRSVEVEDPELNQLKFQPTLASEKIRLQSSGKRWGSIRIYT